MCGICGIIKEEGKSVDINILKSMTDSLIHRGPDDEGFFIEKEAGLGMRRLSIIDIHSGKQPQATKDKSLHIIYNGEIYNYREIRKDLQSKGIQFATNSDTEVILEAYSYYKKECLNHFNGMFAIAIWDSKEKRLFLARDRLGVKPLYYSLLNDGTFIFASEIKALLKYPELKAQIDPSAINNLLTFGFQLAPKTFFNNVSQVLPGHYMDISFESINQFQYWDFNVNLPKFDSNIKDLGEELKFRLNQSVKRRLVSDVPVSAYLSGGIDSSAVSAMYSNLSPGKIKTFSIGFPHEELNELEFSDMVSKHFKTDHFSFMCTPSSSDFNKLIWHLEDPLVTILNLPLFYLSKSVHDAGYKVVLTGDGADEFLGGYSYFKMLKTMNFIARDLKSKSRLNLLQKLNPAIKTEIETENYYNFLKYQMGKINYKSIPYTFYTVPNKEQILSQSMRDKANEDNLFFFFSPEKISHLPLMDQVFYIETKFRLLNLTLPLSDKMSMANSVENRSPFLDYELAEFIFRLPNEMKILGLKEKHIFKKSMQGFLPDKICKRAKKPLTAPAQWFMDLMGEPVDYLLSDEVIKDKGFFDLKWVHFAKSQKSSSKTDYSGILLLIVFIHLWDDLFIRQKT